MSQADFTSDIRRNALQRPMSRPHQAVAGSMRNMSNINARVGYNRQSQRITKHGVGLIQQSMPNYTGRETGKRRWNMNFESGENDMKKEFFDKISAENSAGKPGVLSMHSQEATQSGSTNVLRSSAFPGRQFRERKIQHRDMHVKKGSTIQFKQSQFRDQHPRHRKQLTSGNQSNLFKVQGTAASKVQSALGGADSMISKIVVAPGEPKTISDNSQH